MKSPKFDRRSFFIGTASMLAGLGADTPEALGGIKLGIGASLGGFRPFPEDDAWNRAISHLPVDPRSDVLIKSIGLDKPLHADFGTVYDGRPIGIPYIVVPGNQSRLPVRFKYADESDPGPYPIPTDSPIEGGPDAPEGSDRHLLVIDRDALKLYEMHEAWREGRGWRAGSGAIFDLKKGTTRPSNWTSADAAGLPIFPGLVRHDEVVGSGAIRHALRFTCSKVRRAYVPPARHYVNRLPDPNLPPLGMRVRLGKDFNTEGFPAQARVILEALKTYGMILADVGADWFVSGTHDMRWDDEALGTLRRVKGHDFEVVKMGRIVTG